jgi:hypothetical protein
MNSHILLVVESSNYIETIFFKKIYNLQESKINIQENKICLCPKLQIKISQDQNLETKPV